MGFHKLPSIRHYWSTNPNFHVSRIAEIFSLKRFLNILRYLHINNNQNMQTDRKHPDFDKLYKVRPLVSSLQETFAKAFCPGRNLSVDESMIRFKGRSSIKQYMPMKPIKRGFKVWVCACSSTGYVCNFQIYEGKSTV